MTTTVSKLRPGTAFRVDLGKHKPLDYRLIYVNACRAHVEPLKKRKELDLLEDSPGGRVNIAPTTECEIIDEELDLETMMMTETTKKPTAEKKPRQSGDRKFDPKKQERPVRENTIRAKLLAAIESGKTDINKLMKEFGMARSLLIAHVHEMHKCHGYGYSIAGDVIKISKPVGGVLKAESSVKAKKINKPKKVTDILDDEEDDFLS